MALLYCVCIITLRCPGVFGLTMGVGVVGKALWLVAGIIMRDGTAFSTKVASGFIVNKRVERIDIDQSIGDSILIKKRNLERLQD